MKLKTDSKSSMWWNKIVVFNNKITEAITEVIKDIVEASVENNLNIIGNKSINEGKKKTKETEECRCKLNTRTLLDDKEKTEIRNAKL